MRPDTWGRLRVARCFALLAFLVPARAAAQHPLASDATRETSSIRPGPEFFLGGTLDLAYPFGEKGSPEVNQLIRGDSPFDNLRLRLFADVVLSDRFTLFNQFLIDPTTRLNIATFLRSYLRFTVFKGPHADLHIQGGKIPTPFGAYSPRAYSDQNPLVSFPLLYHYFTTLRSNELPADNADLLAHRGQGLVDLFTGFKGGRAGRNAFNGIPLVYDPCWDVGVGAIGSVWRFEYTAAVSQGTLSTPQMSGGDNNRGKSVAFRLGFVPVTGVVMGGSYSRGPYLDEGLASYLSSGRAVEDFDQEIYGVDLEYGVGHLSLHGEWATSRWTSPNVTDGRGGLANLDSGAWYVEAKYTLRPGLFAAARYDHLTFGRIDDGTGGGRTVTWDDGIRTLEFGLGYSLADRVVAKVIRQADQVDVPGRERKGFWAVQVSATF